MGVGNSGQIYKDKQKYEELHVEEAKCFEGAQKQEKRTQSGGQPQTDRLSSYTDTAGDVSLMSGQQKESIQFDVTATNIHETTNAQKLIDGQLLSEKKQAQLQQQEKELQGSVQTEKKKEKEAPKLDPVYQKIQELKAEFDKDTDSASESFTQVKTALDALIDAAAKEMEKRKDDSGTKDEQEVRKVTAEFAVADALFACRNAAVNYYNQHRGYRWSGKGKRRKDLINQLVDATQQAALSEQMPEFVRDTVIDNMLKDTSETGFASKKSREFFSAQAKKESGNENADEYTYMILHCEQQKQRELLKIDTYVDVYNDAYEVRFRQKEGSYVKGKGYVKGAPYSKTRCRHPILVRLLPSLKMKYDGQGNMYIPEQQEENNALFEQYLDEYEQKYEEYLDRGDSNYVGSVTNHMTDLLTASCQKILSFPVTPQMLTPKYIMEHYAELLQICHECTALYKLMKNDKDFGVYGFHEITDPQLRDQVEARICLFYRLGGALDEVARKKGVRYDKKNNSYEYIQDKNEIGNVSDIKLDMNKLVDPVAKQLMKIKYRIRRANTPEYADTMKMKKGYEEDELPYWDKDEEIDAMKDRLRELVHESDDYVEEKLSNLSKSNLLDVLGIRELSKEQIDALKMEDKVDVDEDPTVIRLIRGKHMTYIPMG